MEHGDEDNPPEGEDPGHGDADHFLDSNPAKNNNSNNENNDNSSNNDNDSNNNNNDDNNNNDNNNNNGNKNTCPSSKFLEQNNKELGAICHQLAIKKNASISTNSTSKLNSTSGLAFDYTIKMAKGAGIHLGLSFIIKDIKCGWLNAAGFEGSRVNSKIK